LSRNLNIIKPIGVPDQTIDVCLFYTWLEWLNDVKEFLKISQLEGMLSVQQKQILVKRTIFFTLKNGELYIIGQYNRL